MGWVFQRLGSSIGLKAVVAVTGIGLIGFVVGHLLGNLQIFEGRQAINAYAQGLRELPLGLLNFLRIGLIAIFLIHIVAAIKLTTSNRSARDEPYAFNATLQASLASRTMIYSGLLVFAFVAYHLAHYTFHLFGEVPMLADGNVDVYEMLILGFSNPLIAILYCFAMIVLGLHLSHGFSSFFQTLGLRHASLHKSVITIGQVLAWAIALAYMSIPLSIWFEFIS